MENVKEIVLELLTSSRANAFVRAHHYSGKVVTNSQLHIGVFWKGELEGVMQFGPSLDKRKMLGLVKGTGWTNFMELNRLAFTDKLPRNSESRAISIALRLIKKHKPNIKWIVSYADGTQCGDGTIYRASGFVLTMIKKNTEVIRMPDGSVSHKMSQKTGAKSLELYKKTKGASRVDAEPLIGFQLRYIYFLDPEWRSRLAVPELPFSAIKEAGASMYKGERGGSIESDARGDQPREDGAAPIPPLQILKPKPRRADV